MPPSERTAAQSDQEDDILERKPSHPVTTTLLIVSAVSLMVAIGITVTELERYVNRETRPLLSDFKKTAVQLHEETYGAAAVDEEGAPSGESKMPKHKKLNKDKDDAPAAPADQPTSSETPPAEGKAPEGKAPEGKAPEGKAPEAPAAPEGGSTSGSTGG